MLLLFQEEWDRLFQPLDVSVNKPFKGVLKNKYISYCIDNGVENLKLSRNKMIEFVRDVWYNNDIISKELIFKSFLLTSIENNLNHCKDNLFIAWK